MGEKKIDTAIKNADSNVAMEGTKNDKQDLTIIREALQRAKNSGSFFWEIVKIGKEQKDNGEINHGKKQR